MCEPVAIHNGVPIFETCALTLVVSPQGFEFCIEGPESDEGPTLMTFGSVEEARDAIDDNACTLARA